MPRKFRLDELLSCAGDRALELIVQRGCGISLPGGIPEPPGLNPVPCAQGWPCLTGRLDWMTQLWFLPTWPILEFSRGFQSSPASRSRPVNSSLTSLAMPRIPSALIQRPPMWKPFWHQGPWQVPATPVKTGQGCVIPNGSQRLSMAPKSSWCCVVQTVSIAWRDWLRMRRGGK